MFTALRATSLTLARSLESELQHDPLLRAFFDSAAGGTMVVSLSSPPNMEANRQEGLSVWLYRVQRDEERLNILPERPTPNQLREVPLPVRLYYLITPLVNAQTPSGPETEQLILGKVLQSLHDRPLLRGEDLSDDFTGTEVELHVRLESHSLDEVAKIRDMLKLEETYELAVSYEVSTVYIESAKQPAAVSPAYAALPGYGVIVGGEGG